MIILTNVEKGIWQNLIIFLDKKYSKKKKPGNRKELVHLDKGNVQKTLTFNGRKLRSGTL